MRFFLPLFVFIPIIEMTLLIKVGQSLGVFYTIALIFLIAVMGLNLLRQQGISTLLKANEKMQQGDLPSDEILEGILIAIGGVLFIVPGFFTDVLGLFCLIPFVRKLMVKQMLKRGMFATVNSSKGAFNANFSGHFASSKNEEVIEGQFSRDDHPRLK